MRSEGRARGKDYLLGVHALTLEGEGIAVELQPLEEQFSLVERLWLGRSHSRLAWPGLSIPRWP